MGAPRETLDWGEARETGRSEAIYACLEPIIQMKFIQLGG